MDRLSCDLGPAWDSPSGTRRRRNTAAEAEPQPTAGASKSRPSASKPGQSGPSASLPTQAVMSSRGNQRRGPNRNSEVGEHGEELSVWKDIREKMPAVLDAFNDSSANVLDIRDQEKRMAEKKEKNALTSEDYTKLDNYFRRGVKFNETASQNLIETIEKLKVLRAVQKAKEEQQESSTSRVAAQRAKESAAASSLYDFDGAGDSPVPSPNPAVPRRMGGGSKGDRDSVPPRLDRSTPAAKAGSAEPQSGPSSNSIRTKQAFAKDDEVAFKPKPTNNEQTDWILGIVQDVRGEGKARRYRVLDADVDENGHQKDFRTSAGSMILIPKEGTVLPPLETGRTVLALYPNTTTFYKAEVMGMDGDGKVNLKFEGEESSNTMQAVTRRHVVEYRG
ncbi:SGF29 tudor-like domain-containing protein [Durotheca rogersii]|uniref:SGF29 tudor-like domain-containing protein n=1 Tax=Durotheca rogersii TaxID=419775 RepID=UPI00221EC0F0|nr:SGF29 tudor-like domain-containing protein [Durotheca rogersii]KAI5856195.1 SGF29 tudor-like domain-containing protein [Durotheca rogersii]